MPYTLQIILGICAPIIAAFSVYIGYQQWKLSAYKLKHDLFDRRWIVYAATNDAIVSHLNRDNEAALRTLQEFNRKRLDANFLFPNELTDYLDQIEKVITELKSSFRLLNSPQMVNDSPERSALEKQLEDQTQWLRAQIENIVSIFHPYLDFTRL